MGDFDKLFIFANTGKEKQETLDFINKCDKHFNLGVVWVEAKINHTKGEGTGYVLTDYNNASMNGEPFTEMLKKYAMPNAFASNCTRELKQRPINKFVNTLGYDYVLTAMGIRYDERHRVSNNAKTEGIIYPLIDDVQIDASFIRNWWLKQPFDLKLKDYEGNCDLCFKKSLRKRLTILKENPKIGEWWLDAENTFATEKIPFFDLRNKLTIQEIIEQSKQPFQTVQDKFIIEQQQGRLFEPEMDFETDCFCKAN